MMPHCCIGVDVIVGFPGESNELFDETHKFLAELDISYLHVFTYSERANTTALRIQEVVPMEMRHERNKRLRILSEKKKRAFAEAHIGHEESVLWEDAPHDGYMNGFTSNYIKVRKPFNAASSNTIESVTISSSNLVWD